MTGHAPSDMDEFHPDTTWNPSDDHTSPTPEGAAAHHRWHGDGADVPDRYEDDEATRIRYAMEDHCQRLRKAREAECEHERGCVFCDSCHTCDGLCKEAGDVLRADGDPDGRRSAS